MRRAAPPPHPPSYWSYIMLNIHFKCLSNHDIQTVSKIFLSATNARVKSIFAGNRHNIMDLNWSNKNANDEELGLLLPPFYSLPPGQVGMNAALQSKINIHHQTMPIQSGRCVCVRAFVGRVRAYFTQNQPTNPACFQKVWARGASPLPSPPATAGFQGSPVSQYFWGGYLIPFFWVSLALFGPPSCRCCFLGRSDSSPPLSSDVVSSEGGDAESFVSTCKRETGGVHWNWRAIARKTFFLCLR